MRLPQELMPGEPAGSEAAGSPGESRHPSLGRAVAIPLVSLVVVGVLMGPLWAWVTPSVARISDGAERVLAGEVAMAGMGVVVGVLVGVVGLLRPGARPT